LSKERNDRVFALLLGYLLPIALLVLIILALAGGFYSAYVEPSPSIFTYLRGIALVVAGVLIKIFFDLLMVKKGERREGIKILSDLLIECEGNLRLVESKKIRWSQVHFDVDSYKLAKEKATFSSLASELRKQILEVYKLISEIEKRKFRGFDNKTDVMLEELAQVLPKIIRELEEKIRS
jgi:hypothetical protein